MQINPLNNASLFFNGVSTGLSRKLAEKLLDMGARLFIIDSNTKALETFRHDLGDKLGNSVLYPVDEMNSFQIESAISKCYNGMKSFDCAVNNYLLPEGEMNILDCQIDYWNSILRINLAKIFSFLKYEISLMVGLNGGCIVNTFQSANSYAVEKNHAAFTLLNAVTGLTDITSKTFRKNKIGIYSFHPEVDNPFPEENNAAGKIDILKCIDNRAADEIVSLMERHYSKF